MVNGNVYSVIRHASSGSSTSALHSLQRDSADCLVNEHGQVFFRVSNVDQLIQHDTIASEFVVDWSVLGTPISISVPAGTYEAHEVRGEVTAIGSLPQPSQDQFPHYYWAAGTGLVRSRIFYSSGIGEERRLVQSHVQ
jgi:hypothetical protein